MHMLQAARWTVLISTSILTAGCGASGPPTPKLVEASGTVLMKGVPLEGARVQFIPQTGAGSVGMTDSQGRFKLMYNGTVSGVVPGNNIIRISKMTGEAGDELVPAKYNTSTKLYLEVKDPGPNDFKIELDGK
jgi:hypothetical protein